MEILKLKVHGHSCTKNDHCNALGNNNDITVTRDSHDMHDWQSPPAQRGVGLKLGNVQPKTENVHSAIYDVNVQAYSHLLRLFHQTKKTSNR